jgi:methionyl-tRNA synthetase
MEQYGIITAGTKVEQGKPIYPRLDMKEEVEYIKQKMQGAAPAKPEVSISAPENIQEITIDDFMKVELRVAEVIGAEPVKKADKLLKIQLDLGYEKRQVVSGIAKYYKPAELVGKKVICVTNLKPVTLRGEQSEGMILAGEQDGVLALASVDQTLPNGSKVK